MSCPGCGRAFEELDPRLFSFNSPHGACEECGGFGEIFNQPLQTGDTDDGESALESELAAERESEWIDESEAHGCPACHGSRLNAVARHVRVQGHTIDEVSGLSAREAAELVEKLNFKGTQQTIAADLIPEIRQRLRFMENVGLGYLALGRSAKTLSGGESQRIRLAAQLGSNLRGVLYVLDEPTIGLHPRDNVRLLDTLAALKEKGIRWSSSNTTTRRCVARIILLISARAPEFTAAKSLLPARCRKSSEPKLLRRDDV